ncbi:MAG: hypothetical protein QXO47_10915, partial [Thermoproteota archaeon]
MTETETVTPAQPEAASSSVECDKCKRVFKSSHALKVHDGLIHSPTSAYLVYRRNSLSNGSVDGT